MPFEQIEINFIIWLQHSCPWLKPFMLFFTYTGYGIFYFFVITICYWCIDRRFGIRMALFLCLCGSLSAVLKQAFSAPRPYWVSPEVEGMLPSKGFGMPSGHAQASTVWLLVAWFIHRPKPAVFLCLLAFLIGFSRIFLGVHFPSQVMCGWMIGGFLVFLFIYIEKKGLPLIEKQNILIPIFFALFISALLIAFGEYFFSRLSGWQLPYEWQHNASVFLKPGKKLNPVKINHAMFNAAAFSGFAVGALILKKMGGMKIPEAFWKKISCYLSGMALMAAGAFLLKISPLKGLNDHYIYIIKGFLLMFIIGCPVPLFFRMVGLAKKE